MTLLLALRQNPPTSLRRYLWAQLVYIPFVWAAGWLWGDWNWRYAAVYAGFTVVILLAILGVIREQLTAWRYPARLAGMTFLLGMVLTRGAFVGAKASFDGYGAISLGEGFFLSWAGILAAFVAPYTKRPDITFTLGMLWIVQAGYDFGWLLHGRLWQEWNWLVPPLTGMVAFSLLAWRLRAVPRAL